MVDDNDDEDDPVVAERDDDPGVAERDDDEDDKPKAMDWPAVRDERAPRQFELVRRSARVNMFDRDGVQFVANDMRLYDLVVWIADHTSHEYMEMAQRSVRYQDAPQEELRNG